MPKPFYGDFSINILQYSVSIVRGEWSDIFKGYCIMVLSHGRDSLISDCCSQIGKLLCSGVST